MVPEQVFGAEEGAVLTDDDSGDPIEEDRPATHVTGGEGGEYHRPSVLGSREAAGVLESVHLSVKDRAPLLHSPVMTSAHDLPIDNQDGPDRDPALRQTEHGLIDGGIEERVGHEEIVGAFPPVTLGCAITPDR